MNLTDLLSLDLSSNYLEYFNTSEVHLGFLPTLNLRHNNLKALDLHQSRINYINIAGNKLRRVDENMLGCGNAIHELSMQNNTIKEISQTAFQRIRFIRSLQLQGNKLESLPGQLFNDTRVSMLFLHNNNLSKIEESKAFDR